jgi:hypothetical protein
MQLAAAGHFGQIIEDKIEFCFQDHDPACGYCPLRSGNPRGREYQQRGQRPRQPISVRYSTHRPASANIGGVSGLAGRSGRRLALFKGEDAQCSIS